MCCFVLFKRYWGIVTVPGFPRVKRPQIIIIEQIELQAKLLNYFLGSNKSNINQPGGCRSLILHLNYVAGYTDPLLFLFERTQQLTPLTTRGKPWRLRVWAGPKFVRPHRWGPWVIKSFHGYWSPQELQNPPPPATEQIKATLVFLKNKRRGKKNPKERDPPSRSQSEVKIAFIIAQKEIM